EEGTEMSIFETSPIKLESLKLIVDGSQSFGYRDELATVVLLPTGLLHAVVPATARSEILTGKFNSHLIAWRTGMLQRETGHVSLLAACYSVPWELQGRWRYAARPLQKSQFLSAVPNE
ncbi:hypothetical protein ACO22_07638, partial [Paracoccidioides brasiliensis]